MIPRSRTLFLKLISVVAGAIVGLFVGLMVIGTLLRLLLDFLFGWGDSGPAWVTWVIGLATIASILTFSRLFLTWAQSRSAGK
jgi:hypothetical protein